MIQLLLFILCKLMGHKMYRKDEGYAPVYRKEKCARCGYETKAYPIDTVNQFTIRA